MANENSSTLTDEEQEEWKDLIEADEDELSDAQKTSKIKLSIKRKYAPPEWALAFELASPDGRRADAIAVNTFPSRNFKTIGFEFKSSRSDWLREKNEGGKADYFVQAVDEWYIVAWSGIVDEDELPEGWGLLELKPNSEQLWTQVESNLTTHQQGTPDKAFWARFIKKTVGEESNYTRKDVQEARRRGYEEGKEEGESAGHDVSNKKLQRKAEQWDALQENGLDWLFTVDDETIREINKAREFLRLLDEGGYKSLRREFNKLVDTIGQVDAQLSRFENSVSVDLAEEEDTSESSYD